MRIENKTKIENENTNKNDIKINHLVKWTVLSIKKMKTKRNELNRIYPGHYNDKRPTQWTTHANWK